MKIGIIADTHDNLPKIEKAVDFFNSHQVYCVFHAGDFVAPFTISRLDKLTCEWQGVFGNNDGERVGLSGISEGKIVEGPLRTEIMQRKIILVHDLNTVKPEEEDAQVVIYGHTHKDEVIRRSTRLLINPGECGGWLSGKSTVAIVDLATMSGEIFKI